MSTQRVSTPPPPQPDELEPSDGEELRMTIWEHLDDLRKRVFRAFLGIIIGTAIGVPLAQPMLEYLIKPYGERLMALAPTEPVVAYFRIALMIGGVLSVPVVTYQLLMFIIPGLTRRERRYLIMILPAISGLFIVGGVFAWFILVPPALQFLVKFQDQIFRPSWTADLYLSFITSLIFWMGVAFETPLVFFTLSVLGFVRARTLLQNWRIAIVGASIAAAVITPTVDPVNMALVMGPLLALYALSIILVGIGQRINQNQAG
jgi:sec-independent protein translocase protein TatC